MRPPAELLDRLTGFRLRAGGSSLSARPGERRSPAKGAGLEFAGHRPYREGDDLRHLDVRLYARLRVPFVRQYAADRQLRVAILVDTSVSMGFGDPAKRTIATRLAGLLAYAGLASGDLVEVGLAQGARILWSDALQGASRAHGLFGWIDAHAGESPAPFPEQIKAALPRWRHANLAIVISDWWMDDLDRDLAPLHGLAAEVCAVHLTAPEDDEPWRVGGGPLRLSDAETGAALDIAVDAAGIRQYAELLAAYRQTLRATLERQGGRYLALRCDQPPGEMLAQIVKSGLLQSAGRLHAAG